MKIKGIGETIMKASKTAGFKIKKASPEILVVCGGIGIIAGVVVACKQTIKAHDILEKSKEEIAEVHAVLEDETIPEETYSEKDSQKDIATIYIRTGLKLAKVYAPAVIIIALSMTGMISSNQILRKRNAALTAAFGVLNKDFKKYRERIIERFGEDADYESRFDTKEVEVSETLTNEDGNDEVVTKKEKVIDKNSISEFSVFFDESCPDWKKNPEYNKTFLLAQQEIANAKLRAEGILFLNDIFEALGLPKTRAGQVVGWYFDEKDPNCHNYISFGLENGSKERTRAFMNGYENVVLLDFNVDGNVWERM